jgi:probable nitrogen fixation protein
MIGRHRPAPAEQSAFLKHLVRQFRAQDSSGTWDGKSDWELLEPLILTPAKRRELPIFSDPDPEVFWRIELFYGAVGMAIEERAGVSCEPMLKMHHEGFGRLVLVAGRLVVVNRFLRDVHRFGFETVEKLAAAGERLVNEGVEMIERFPEAAQWA